MFAIIPILLNIHLMPLPMDSATTGDPSLVKAKQISSEDDLAFFSENFFLKPFNELSLKNHSLDSDMAETGLIEDGIFFVYDKKGNTLGVLKVMPTGDLDDEILFEEEYSAIETLRKIPFQHFHIIELLGRAQGEVNGKEALILAESVAEGKTINQWLKDYGKMTSTGGKKEALNDLKSALNETALAFTELHNHSKKLRANPEYLEKYSGHLPGPYGLIHGDSHPGNIFYDKETNKTTFIDFQMTPNIKDGGPIGYDIANFLTTVELLGSYKNISREDMQILTDSFLTTYLKNGPTIKKSDIAFYQKEIFKRFSSFEDEDLTGPDGHQVRFIRDYSLEKLATV